MDPDGEALHIAVGAGIGALVGGLSTIATGGSLRDIAAATVGGAVTGGMAAATCGMSLGATIAGSAMAGTAGYLAESMVAGNQATIEGAVVSGLSGATGAVVDKAINTGAAKVSQASQSAKVQSHSNHGNSLNTTKPAKGYALRNNDTDDILKYGETTRGENRYTKKYLKENNAYMDFQANGTKREMHDWQHEKILEYKANNNGQRPPLNKSDW